jgi:hypothetical protein
VIVGRRTRQRLRQHDGRGQHDNDDQDSEHGRDRAITRMKATRQAGVSDKPLFVRGERGLSCRLRPPCKLAERGSVASRSDWGRRPKKGPIFRSVGARPDAASCPVECSSVSLLPAASSQSEQRVPASLQRFWQGTRDPPHIPSHRSDLNIVPTGLQASSDVRCDHGLASL